MKEWNVVEVDDKIVVPFAWRDTTPGGKSFGRAEFQVCVEFKKGKKSQTWIYPQQQRVANDCWHLVGGDREFSIKSYQELDAPGVWLAFYCKEHKTTSFRIYVPTDSKFLVIDRYGISFYRTHPDLE